MGEQENIEGHVQALAISSFNAQQSCCRKKNTNESQEHIFQLHAHTHTLLVVGMSTHVSLYTVLLFSSLWTRQVQPMAWPHLL